MSSKKLVVVLLVALVGVPSVASARISKSLAKELDGYVAANKRSDDAEAKQAALMTEGRVGGRKARKDLAGFAKDSAERVRLGALMGRWFAGDRHADDKMVAELAKDSGLYLTLTDIVSVLPDKKEEPLLSNLIRKADPAHKRDIFRYLAQQHGKLYSLLGKYLTGRDDKDRAAAVQAAMFTARDEAIDYAKKMVRSRHDDIRADGVELAIGLAQRPGGSDKAVAIVESAVDDHSDAIADKAARFLVEHGNKKGVSHLMGELAKASKDDKKADIAQYLLDNDAKVSAKDAKALMDAENKKLSALGWQLAATSGGNDMVGKLRKMFQSTHFDERIVAVKAMGRTHDKKMVGMLGKALFEGNRQLRLDAAKSLGRIGDAQGLVFLQKALTGERDRDVKIAVIDAVSRIKKDKSLQLLRFQTTDRDPKVKLAIVRGIRRLGKKEGVQALQVIAQDRNLKVQWQAFLTALELDPHKGFSQMSRMLRNPPDGFMADIEQLAPDTRNKVIAYLLAHGNDQARAAALSTARRIGKPMFPTYRKVVADTTTPASVRRTLLVALSEARAKKDQSLFEKLARTSGDKGIRRLAAWTLTEYGGKDLEATFRGLLGSDDPAVKSIAAYGLAVIHH